jgi:hypothetical protein
MEENEINENYEKISKYDDGFVVKQDEPVQKIDDIEIKQIEHEPDETKL